MHITHAHRWKLQLDKSDCNEEVWNESDEEVWNEDFDTDLENGSDDTSDIPEVIQADATPQSALAKWLLVFILYLQSIFHLSDSVVGYLIKFMKTFFGVVGRFCTACICAGIAAVFPSSLYTARKTCHIDDLKFKRCVVCHKCHRLYFLKECISGTGIAQRSTVCPYKAYPNHPHRRMRTQCGTLLLKTVELASGRKVFYPFMTYCYLGLQPLYKLY